MFSQVHTKTIPIRDFASRKNDTKWPKNYSYKNYWAKDHKIPAQEPLCSISNKWTVVVIDVIFGLFLGEKMFKFEMWIWQAADWIKKSELLFDFVFLLFSSYN